MRNFSTWMLMMFVIMFWGFRVIVAVMAQLNQDFGGIVPLNFNLEIILLFVVLVCMILIVKRKLIGAIAYLLVYGLYFGTDLVDKVKLVFDSIEPIAVSTYANMFISFIGIIIPVAVLLDMLADKNRKANPKDKKTDWFYNNEEFDRKMDDRADKNNYRTL